MCAPTRRLDDNVFFTNNYPWRETWTAADGRSFTLSGNGIFKDVKAQVPRRIAVPVQVPRERPAVRDHRLGRQGHLPRPRELSPAATRSTSGPASSTSSETSSRDRIRCSTSTCARPSHRSPGSATLPKYLTAAADRLDRLSGGLRRIPAAELHARPGRRARCSCSSTATARPATARPRRSRRLVAAGIPQYINVGGWPTDRPFVVLAPQHVEDPPGFDFSSCDGAPVGRVVQHAGPARPRERRNRPSARRRTRSTTSSTTRSPTTTSTRRGCTSPGCRAAPSASGSTWRSTAAIVKVAAAVPIAGDGRPAWAPALLRPRCDTDLGVPRRSRRHGRPARQHRADDGAPGDCGVPAERAKLTVYPDRDHNSWDPAYGGANGDDIYSWMLGFTNP